MASSINAITTGSGGVITTADNSGDLNIQSGGVTKAAITSAGLNVVGTFTVNGSAPTASQWTTSGSDIYYTTGSVGIGNSSMSSFNTGYNNLVVGSGTGNEGLAIYAGSASSCYLGFKGAASTSAQGLFEYDCSTNTLYTYTNGTFRTSIDGSGIITFFNTPSTSLSGANWRVAGNQCYMNWSHGSQTTKAEYIYWINGNGTVGSIFATGSSTTYATSSDYRLKEDVKPMVGALEKVALLKPVTYKWKCDGTNGQGFIAHELQEVVPECVGGEKDAVNEDGSIKPQGIDTSFLVATLTAAIQEQQALIENLTTRLTALENK